MANSVFTSGNHFETSGHYRLFMTEVPQVSERELWLAELDLADHRDLAVRRAQFAIRTAVRAQSLAKQAGTDPIDELLEARGRVNSPAAKMVFCRAIDYLHTDRLLDADRHLRRLVPEFADPASVD